MEKRCKSFLSLGWGFLSHSNFKTLSLRCFLEVSLKISKLSLSVSYSIGHLNSKKYLLGAKLVVKQTKISHLGLVWGHLLQNWWIATASKFSLLEEISHPKIGKQKWVELDSWYFQGRFIRVLRWFFHSMVKVISLIPTEILHRHPLAIEA